MLIQNMAITLFGLIAIFFLVCWYFGLLVCLTFDFGFLPCSRNYFFPILEDNYSFKNQTKNFKL